MADPQSSVNKLSSSLTILIEFPYLDKVQGHHLAPNESSALLLFTSCPNPVIPFTHRGCTHVHPLSPELAARRVLAQTWWYRRRWHFISHRGSLLSTGKDQREIRNHTGDMVGILIRNLWSFWFTQANWKNNFKMHLHNVRWTNWD